MKKITCLFILFVSSYSFSQVKFKFKQYMLHQTVFNPGYIDTETKYSYNSIYRRQWQRKDSYPEAFLAYGHYNPNPTHGFGLLLSNDLISSYNQFEMGANYVYNVKLANELNLGLGAKIGFIEQNYIPQQFTYFDPVEPVLSEGNYTSRFINFGTGISLTSPSLSLHVGLPQIFGNRFINQSDIYTVKNAQLYANFGYKFRSNDWFVFYPNIMLYATKGSRIHGSFYANFLAGQLLFTGVGVDTDLSINGMIGLFIFSGFRVVYSIDNQIFSKDKITGISHEVSVSYAKSLKYNPFKRRKTGRFRR